MVDTQTPRSSAVTQTGGGAENPARSFACPDLLGYVFHLLWMFLLFYNPDSTSTAIGGSPLPTNLVYVTSMLALVATLAVGFARPHAFMRAAQSAPMAVAAPVVTSLGTVAYFGYSVTEALGLAMLGGVMTGAGSAVLAARWAAVFGNATPREIIDNFTLILVAISVAAATVEYLPDGLWCALLVLLPLVSGACLRYARSCRRADGDGRAAVRRGRDDADAASPAGRGRTRRLYLAMALLVGLVGLCTGSLSAFSPDGSWVGGYCLVFNVVAAVLVTGFVGVMIFRNDRAQFVQAFVVPLLVLVLVFIPFEQFVAGSLGKALYPVGSVAFELMFLFVVVLFALNADLSPARSFMLARATLAVTDALGSLLGGWIVASLGASAGLQAAGVFLFASAELLVLALAVGYVLIARRSSLLRAAGDGGEAARAGLAGLAGDAAGAGLAEKVAGAQGATGVARDAGCRAQDCPEDRGAFDAEARCDEIAREFGLSDRELDVLRLLAAGKGSAAIQDELCIAQGTVNYHMRNIYAKCGVHSRQELMLLVLGGRG